MSIQMITDFLKSFLMTAKDILPVSLFLILFQLFILKTPLDNVKELATGILFSVMGLFLFTKGLEKGLVPLGQKVGQSLPQSGSVYMIILFAFILGYTTTLAEPALASLGSQVEELSSGAMHSTWLIHTVSLGVGIGVVLGMLKIILGIPSTYLIVPILLVTALLGYLAPERITGIAFDAAGVTTGPVTVPLNMALAIGLSSAIGGSDPLIDGFGVIALASLGPIITVLSLGILIKF